jgi:hypothetical protein
MKVRPDRLLGHLKTEGFGVGVRTYAVDSLTFVRPSFTEDLFESVIVEAQGRHGEAVGASVGVSITKTVAFKVLGDVRLLDELDENKERCWTIITDDRKARQWECELARLAPSRAREWAQKTGPGILKTTAETRLAVKRYLARLQPQDGLEEVLAHLKATTPPEIAKNAERLVYCPGASGVEGTEVAYEVACYAILRYSTELEGRSFAGLTPLEDASLMNRIKVLGDWLLDFDIVPEPRTSHQPTAP